MLRELALCRRLSPILEVRKVKALKLPTFKAPKAKIYGLAGIILVLAIAGGGAFWKLHETPAFCGACHTMDKYVDSYTDI